MVGTHSPPAELVCGGLSGGWGFAFGSRVREDLCVRGCDAVCERSCAQLQSQQSSPAHTPLHAARWHTVCRTWRDCAQLWGVGVAWRGTRKR